MLDDLLKSKKCFKLVCGAGNEDEKEIEKLVALYSKAGCKFFDLCAKPEILNAAKRGLNRSITKSEQSDYHFCISVGIKGDPHISKARIKEKKCVQCKKCIKICPQNAIFEENGKIKIKEEKCIGCSKCEKICKYSAIKMKSKDFNLKHTLSPLIKEGIDCIELHAMGEDDKEVFEKWKEISALYDGILSLCIGRENIGNKKMIERISKLIKKRAPFSTIIQADGNPMSGGEDNFKSTLQAVACAEIIQEKELPIYLLISGGTNTKSKELLNMCEVPFNGIAIGSYARKIVKQYIEKDDFLDNKENFEKALEIAKKLISTVE